MDRLRFKGASTAEAGALVVRDKAALQTLGKLDAQHREQRAFATLKM